MAGLRCSKLVNFIIHLALGFHCCWLKVHVAISLQVRLCKLSFSLFEYSVEILIEYSSTQLKLEVAFSYRVIHNKGRLVPHSSLSYNNGLKWVKIMLSQIRIKQGRSLQNLSHQGGKLKL